MRSCAARIVVLVAALAAGAAGSPAAWGQAENIGSSTVPAVTPAAVLPGTLDLCFTASIVSGDLEYMDRFDVDLPDAWTVNSVSANSTPAAAGCSGALPPVSGTAAGNVVYWQSTGYPPTTGCGAWTGSSSGSSYDFCVNVTIPECTGAPWSLPWNVVGDGYGSAPHSAAGTYSSITCAPAAISLVKTVGTAPGVCAATTSISVMPGTTVYYCYEVTNTGTLTLNLHDLADDQLGTIFTGLSYALTPGASVDTVAAGLSIPAVVSADVTNTATWTAYNAGPVDVATAQASATVTVIPADVDVSPASLAVAHATPTSTQETLTIANAGGFDLDWTLAEEPVAMRFPPMPGPAGDGDAAQAAERVGAEPEGSSPYPATNPVTWSRPRAVLYDNGPLVTHPGGGGGGLDASALQTVLGMTSYGAGAQLSAGNRVADDFTVTDPAGWAVDTVTFFTYQSFSGNTSTITGVNLRIWDGPPNDPGSSVVWGDTTTNVMASTAFSSIYRVLDTALTNTDRPIMAVVANVGHTLAAGTYWLDWQFSGSLSSGPWQPPISILGQTATGNAIQYTTSGWAAITDVGPQGLPFVVDGAVAICGALADVPWLSANPVSGTLSAGSNVPVTVTFDSTGLGAGSYSATICVFSDDPDEPVVPVPVSLDVAVPVELMRFSAE